MVKPAHQNIMKKNILLSTILFLSLACAENKQEHVGMVHPEWSKDAVIYEVNIRQHTLEGTFNAFSEDIPRLKAMGIDILWIMPIHPVGEKNRKGNLGSYYSITDYKSVNPEFGSKEDFRKLVKTAHSNGMKLIIDWVANHTAWDHPWTESHPEYYVKNAAGEFQPPVADWSDVIHLDYSNAELRNAMLDAMKYWVSEFDIDGYRCDVAEMVPVDFWNRARKELDEIKPVFMLSEGQEPEHHQEAFDMTYAWELMHLMRQVAAGKEKPQAIKDMYARDMARYPEGYYKMNIITNHDENSWNGTAEEFFGAGQSAWFVFTATTYGMPLVYSGQEANNKKRIEFFEKDPIDWSDGYVFNSLYKALFDLKEKNPALWNGNYGGSLNWVKTNHDDSVLAYRRIKGKNEVLILLNVSGNPLNFTLDRDYGTMKNILEDSDTVVGIEQSLPAYGYKVFAK